MPDEPLSPEEVQKPEVPAFAEYEVPGVGTVIDPQGEPGYRVRLPDGQVTAYPAASGDPCEANAASDIATAIATPRPAPVVVLTPLTVLSRLTGAEPVAIFTSEDPEVRVWRAMALAAQEIRTDDPRTDAGFALLVGKGLLGAGRQAEIMQ